MAKKHRPPIPQFDKPIIETHCHLDYLDQDSLSSQLSLARDVGVSKFVTIAVSKSNLDTTVELATDHSDIWTTQGIHPHNANDYDEQVERKIRTNILSDKVVAIGEIGLDYHYNHCDRKIQTIAFERQLQIASELDLPVVIHTRQADEDTIQVLRQFSKLLKYKGVIHSFTSSIELAEFCLSENFKLGFNGIATFKSADNVREVIKITPLAQIVLETDSPYLTPVPYRGRPNSPCYLPFIADEIAKIKGLSIDHLLESTYANSLELFSKLTLHGQ